MTGVAHNSGLDLEAGAGKVVVSLPTGLVRLFPGSPNEVEVEAGTVRDVIDALNEMWPGMRDRLIDSRPAIRKHLNIFVAGEKARLDTPLPSGARVIIMTAMSGG
ncbi:MAG: MoaD/ThiS family protein [Alphaproteobacteria bacterium]|nr:MoaD/ThiS family protein [Alphaproteobacteria bacterium]